MKNDLTCAVVRDLLPSYVEGLTSEETNQAVDAHLAGCPDCAAQKDAMAAPEETAEQRETAKEVDYLKTVKWRNRQRVVLAVICVALVIAAAAFLKVCVIGTPAQSDGMSVEVYYYVGADKVHSAKDQDTLYISVCPNYAPMAYWGWKMETKDGVVDIQARQVTRSPLFQNEQIELEVPMEGVTEIRIGGRTIVQEGTIIEYDDALVYALQTPYVGDAPAVGRLLEEIDQWHGPIGRRSFSLQTSSQPYGMTVELDGTRYWQGEPPSLYYRYSVRLLALVENLDYVSWVYTDPAGDTQCLTITQEDALDYIRLPAMVMDREDDLRDSIKAYAASMLDFQKLCDLTDSR